VFFSSVYLYKGWESEHLEFADYCLYKNLYSLRSDFGIGINEFQIFVRFGLSFTRICSLSARVWFRKLVLMSFRFLCGLYSKNDKFSLFCKVKWKLVLPLQNVRLRRSNSLKIHIQILFLVCMLMLALFSKKQPDLRSNCSSRRVSSDL